MLGAQRALIGTRFYAATEALGHEGAKERIVAAKGPTRSERGSSTLCASMRGLSRSPVAPYAITLWNADREGKMTSYQHWTRKSQGSEPRSGTEILIGR